MDEKIIKSTGGAASSGLGVKVVKKEVYSASLEAEDIVEKAREQGRRIIETTRVEAERLAEEAREQAYSEGLAQWNQAVADVLAAREQFLHDSEREVVRLAVKIAEKIIGGHLQTHPEAIVGIVREALKSAYRERNLVIKVHPSQVETVSASIQSLLDALGGSREIQVVGWADVSPGGCVVESELGKIDARLETQLRVLEEMLLRAGR